MNLLFYPGLDSVDLERGYNEVKGATGKAIKDLCKHHKDIYLKVKFFFRRLKDVHDLEEYLKVEEILQFHGTDLYEMRIPKQRRGGVFRIYFCFSLEQDKTEDLILLDAELKHKTKPMRLESAKEKLKAYYRTFGKEAQT